MTMGLSKKSLFSVSLRTTAREPPISVFWQTDPKPLWEHPERFLITAWVPGRVMSVSTSGQCPKRIGDEYFHVISVWEEVAIKVAHYSLTGFYLGRRTRQVYLPVCTGLVFLWSRWRGRGCESCDTGRHGCRAAPQLRLDLAGLDPCSLQPFACGALWGTTELHFISHFISSSLNWRSYYLPHKVVERT